MRACVRVCVRVCVCEPLMMTLVVFKLTSSGVSTRLNEDPAKTLPCSRKRLAVALDDVNLWPVSPAHCPRSQVGSTSDCKLKIKSTEL